jgi:hypothetical protein
MSESIRIGVTLTPDETARLDEMRSAGVSRSGYLRQLLYKALPDDDPPTHREALALLTRSARQGRVTAAIALERALRPVPGEPIVEEESVLDAIFREEGVEG